MTKEEHLLTILAEECMEVAQRCSKALRFGLDEVQPGQSLTNSQRITEEFGDLLGAFELLHQKAEVARPSEIAVMNKIDKIEVFMGYSRQCGTLTEGGQP
ncbi:MAG TPA: hypothetical protein VNQ90_00045 [Chthoniobacteraceae bacterium]|nr:hypothetical protein [Chthoniobacteraceae bacterium]